MNNGITIQCLQFETCLNVQRKKERHQKGRQHMVSDDLNQAKKIFDDEAKLLQLWPRNNDLASAHKTQ